MGPAAVRLTRGAGRSMLAGVASLGIIAGAVAGITPATADASPTSSPAAAAASRALTPGSGPVSTAVVVPITVPTGADGKGIIGPDDLTTYTAPNGVLSRQLAAVTGTAAVLAIDPMIVVSIRVLGTAAPASASAWLNAFEALPNEKIPLAYADADPAVLTRVAGGAALLKNLDFQFAITPGDFGPAQTATPTPTTSDGATATPTPTPSATSPPGRPPLPSNKDLLAGDYVSDDIAWPAAGTVSQSELDPLRDAGYRFVLLGSGNVSSAASGRVSLDGIDGLVSDDGLSSIAREATGAFGDAALQSALQRFDTALSGMQAVSPGRSAIVTLDRGWSVSATHVRELLLNIDAQASAQSVGLSAVLSGPSVPAKVVDGAPPADGAALVDPVVATQPQEAAFATIAGDQAFRVTGPRRLELLSTVSVAWVESGTGWADRLRAYLASSAALLGSVKVVHGSNVLVTATVASIPVTVSNALPVPIVVNVTVDPQSTLLRIDKRQVPLKVEANATGRALIGAQALGTVTVGATISLHSAASPTVPVGVADTIRVDLRPSWEGIGTGIIAAILFLLFGGGIVRQVLKRRRARRERDAGDAEPEFTEAEPEFTEAEPAEPRGADPKAADPGDAG